MAPVKVKIEQDPEKPVERTVLAAYIIEISTALTRLVQSSGLNQRAIVTLLHDSTSVGKPDIRAVLHGITHLRNDFCTK